MVTNIKVKYKEYHSIDSKVPFYIAFVLYKVNYTALDRTEKSYCFQVFYNEERMFTKGIDSSIL